MTETLSHTMSNESSNPDLENYLKRIVNLRLSSMTERLRDIADEVSSVKQRAVKAGSTKRRKRVVIDEHPFI